MYKVSEVAEMLAVDNTKIYEQLIVHRELLDPVTRKEQGVLHFETEGVKLLAKLLKVKPPAGLQKKRVLTDYEKQIAALRRQAEILFAEVRSLDEEIAGLDARLLGYAEYFAERLFGGAQDGF